MTTLCSPRKLVAKWRCAAIGTAEVATIARKTSNQTAPNSLPDDFAPVAPLAAVLRRLHTSMQNQFGFEAEICDALAGDLWCVEVDATKRQVVSSQEYLVSEIDTIMALLDSPVMPNNTRESIIERWELLADKLEQHQDHVADSFQWLLSVDCGG